MSGDAALNSVYASGLAGAVTVAVSPFRSPWSSSVDLDSSLVSSIELAYVGYALPGVDRRIRIDLLHLAGHSGPLSDASPRSSSPMRCSFLPQAISGVRASMVRVQPGLEEAARVHSIAAPWQTFYSITLPLIAPGVLAGVRPGLPHDHEGTARDPAARADRVRHLGDYPLGTPGRRVLRPRLGRSICFCSPAPHCQ